MHIRTGPRLAFMACAMLGSLAPAAAQPPVMGGEMVGVTGEGRTIAFPLMRSDVTAELAGDLATVSVVQTFTNPGTVPLDVTYLFPLNRLAAVHRMTMTVGEEVVEARIAERQQARATFETARREGRNAALLEQHRPNMFTQSVANVMPGQAVTVALRYAQTVPRVDGAYELVIPLVVGPRYNEPPEAPPADDLAADDRSPVPGQWSFGPAPALPPIDGLTAPPGTVESDRVGLTVLLDGGMPIAEATSPSHQLATEELSPSRRRLTLAAGGTIDNRDFLLRYRLGGEAPAAGLLAHHDARGGFFSLLLEPPRLPAEDQVSRREMVFVLDCSGSMSGAPLQASKAFMLRALDRLRPGDSFRIIRFSDGATEFAARPLPATPEAIRQGKAHIATLVGEGGTNMSQGIRQALAAPAEPGVLRLVTFLTDGYIGDEARILHLIHQHRGDARLFAVGIGSSVNRFLLDEMGRVGRGVTRIIDPAEPADRVAEDFADRLQSPVLTDLSIDWGGLAPSELTQDALPDLFAGHSLRLQGRYAKPGRYTVTIRGKVNGRAAELPLEVELPESGGNGEAVASIWARTAIKREMDLLMTPASLRPGGIGDDALRQRVTRLGLEFSLVTQWTSFVAASQHIANAAPTDTVAVDVPLPMVANVGPGAYGTGTSFHGNATPEPEVSLGMLAVALLLARAARRRSRPKVAV